MKRFFIILLVLLAAALPALAGETRVVDEANLLTFSEEAQLQNRIDQIKEAYQIDVAIVTQKDIGYRSPGLYAADYYDEHGYGVGENRDGLIFLISMADRDYFTGTTGKAKKIFSGSKLDHVQESMLPRLSRGDYYRAMSIYLDEVEHVLENYNPLNRTLAVAPIILLVGVGVALIVSFSLKRQLKTVRRQSNASSYMVKGSFQLTRSNDIYLYTTTKRVRIVSENSGGHGGGGHGGGGGSFRSSSGRSFGGRGGKF